MKRKLSIFFSAFLAILLIAGMIPALTKAEGDPYTYTIRVFAGEQGTINGGAVYEQTLNAGERFTFSMSMVTEKPGSKYTKKGIRESGKDNSEALNALSFQVTKDQDFVVAYGITGKMIPYTVSYINADTGEALGPADTFYCADGEKPVAGFKYFEGFEPEYYNITGTVVSGQENAWVFQYHAVVTPEPESPTTEPTEPTSETETTTEAPAEGGGGEEEAEGGEAAGGAEGGAAAGGAGEEAAPAEPEAVAPAEPAAPGGEAAQPAEEPSTPQEIIDIDETTGPAGVNTTETSEEALTPATGTDGNGGGTPVNWATVGIVAGGVVVAAGIIALIAALAKRKKNKE